MENGYPLGKDLENVQFFFERGIRYITLTHSKNNDLGDSSTDEPFGNHDRFPCRILAISLTKAKLSPNSLVA